MGMYLNISTIILSLEIHEVEPIIEIKIKKEDIDIRLCEARKCPFLIKDKGTFKFTNLLQKQQNHFMICDLKKS